ncbi:MAG TPA: hypothetical protein PKN75_02275 [Bacteroidia bacterium]|nr:hypothetical protein [Bacteroidia bacterium]HNU32401.1 hypothetical protein [Bacteroidia bacterium]
MIETYSRDSLIIISQISVPFPQSTHPNIKYNFENLIYQKGKYRLFYSWFNWGERRKRLSLIDFDERGALLNHIISIDSSNANNERKAGDFSVINLASKGEFLCVHNQKFFDTVNVKLSSFDFEGRKLKSQTFFIGPSFGEQYYSFIGEDGVLYYILRGKKSGKNKEWKIKTFSPESGEPFEVLLNHPELKKQKISPFFKVIKNENGNSINLITTYSIYNDVYSPDGIYWIKFDQINKKILSENFVPFYNFERRTMYNPYYSRMAGGVMVEVMPLEETKIKVIFESRELEKTTYYGSTVSETYFIKNIQVFTLDTSKTIGYCKIIKDQQVSPKNVKYTGYVSLFKNDTTSIIYNELPSNLNVKDDYKLRKLRNSRVDDTYIISANLNDTMILNRNVPFEKVNPNEVDAILPSKYLKTKPWEVFLLREIEGKEYLCKFYYE